MKIVVILLVLLFNSSIYAIEIKTIGKFGKTEPINFKEISQKNKKVVKTMVQGINASLKSFFTQNIALSGKEFAIGIKNILKKNKKEKHYFIPFPNYPGKKFNAAIWAIEDDPKPLKHLEETNKIQFCMLLHCDSIKQLIEFRKKSKLSIPIQPIQNELQLKKEFLITTYPAYISITEKGIYVQEGGYNINY